MEELQQLLSSSGLLNEGFRIEALATGFLLSLVFSWLIALIYKWVNRARADVQVMMQTLILLSITISAAMMIIGNNLARAFGLVGAVSIIRFRTTVKSSKDMAFVFVAIVIGMSCGLGFGLLALAFTAFSGLVLLAMEWLGFGRRRPEKMRFQLEIKSRGAGKHRQNAEEVLRQLELPWKLSGIKTGSKGTTLSYLLEVGDESKLDRLSEDLQAGRGARGKKDISVRLVRQ